VQDLTGLFRIQVPPSWPHPRCQVSDVTAIVQREEGLVKFDELVAVLVGLRALMWWPFRRQPESPSVLTRLEHLESTVRGLQTAFKDIETDWELTYRKMHNALTSLNQKQRAAEKAVQVLEDAPGKPNGADPGMTLMEARRRVLSR